MLSLSLYVYIATHDYIYVACIISKIFFKIKIIKNSIRDFPGGTVLENLPVNAGDTVWSPGPRGSHMPQSS